MSDLEKIQPGAGYVSSTTAATAFGVTNDYIARLCRSGKLRGVLEGRVWLVETNSLRWFFGRDLPGSVDAPLKIYYKDTPTIPEVHEVPPQVSANAAILTMFPREAAAENALVLVPRITVLQIARTMIVAALLVSVSGLGYGMLLNRSAAFAVRSNEVAAAGSVGFLSGVSNTARSVAGTIDTFVYNLFYPHNAGTSQVVIVHTDRSTLATSSPTVVTRTVPPVELRTALPAQTIINNPVIERIVERERLVSSGGITEAFLNQHLDALENKLRPLIFASVGAVSSGNSAIYNVIAQTNRIDMLGNVDIKDSRITHSSISDSTFTNATLTGTTTLSALALGTATSTAGNGFNISSGCFAVNGVCITGGGAGTPGGVDGGVQFNSNGSLAATSTFLFSTSSDRLLITNASTTNLSVSGSIAGAGLSSCSGSLDKIQYNSATRQFVCGTDQTGGGGGSDTNWTFFNNSGLRPATTTNQVLIGGIATTTNAKLQVIGGALIDNATSSALNTNLLGIGGSSYFNSLTGNGLTNVAGTLTIHQGQAFSTTSVAYWDTTQARWATTSTDYWKTQTNFYSTTSADFWKTQNNFFSTTSASAFLALNQGNAFSTTSTAYFAANGLAFSTTSDAYFLSQNQGSAFSTTSAAYNLATYDKGFFFSTTSVSYWDSTQARWATTSTAYFLSQNQGAAFSTTSANALLATQDKGFFFSTTSANFWNSVGLSFSTTSASFYSSVGLAFSTTSASYFLGQNTGNSFSTTSANYFSSVGLGFSTTSTDYWKTQNNFHSTTSFAYNLVTYDKGFFFSTTSVAYWDTTQFRWATTSSDAWLATKSTSNLAEGSNLYYTSSRATSSFIALLGATTTDALAEGVTNQYYTSARDIRFSTTSANYFSSLGLAFATTSTDYWKTQNNFFSTSSAAFFAANGLAFSTTSDAFFASNGLAFSTTSSSYFLSQNTGNAFSTTSALFFSSVGLAHSTTSALFYSSVGLAHSTTSVAYQLTQTPVMSNGFTAFASSTIGNGTATGGLSISGGATTTGNFITNLGTIASSTFVVGTNGYVNPAFQIFGSTTNAATGLSLTSNIVGNGTALSVTSSGTNEDLNIAAKGTGALRVTSDVYLRNSSLVITTGQISMGGLGNTTGSNVTLDFSPPGSNILATANTEVPFFRLGSSQNIIHSSGVVPLQRDYFFRAPRNRANTYAVTNRYIDLATIGIESPPITSQNATTTNAYALLIGSSTASTYLDASTTNSYGLAVWTTGGALNTYSAIFNGGNVGIGTTSPGTQLSIQGVGNFSSGTSTFYGTGGFNIAAGCFAVNGSCVGNDGTFSTTSSLFFSSVGLAHSTTSVAYQLTQTPVFTNGFTAFASSTIGNGTATGGLTISGGATTTGNAYFAGNVGIGTSTPYGALQVSGAYGGLPTSPGVHMGMISNFAETQLYGTAGGILDFSGRSGGDYDFRIIHQPSANSLMFAASTTQNILVLTSNGNVGIGTTTPADKLDVVGTLRLESSNKNGCIRYNSGSGLLEYANDCSSYQSFTSASAGGWTNAGGITRLTTASDIVGIGTSSPPGNYPLTVSGQVNSDRATFPGYAMSVGNVTKGFVFYDTTNNVVQLGNGGFANGISVNTASGTVGISTSTPSSTLTVFKPYGSVAATMLDISSSTNAANNTQTTFLSVSSTGFGTTTLSGLNIAGSATSTSNVGFNIAAGCFSINGVCQNNASGFSTTSASYFASVGLSYSTTSVAFQLTQTPVFSNGFTAFASSTIGNGTATGGLTISGGATTTGSLTVTGTGTSTMAESLYIGTTTIGTSGNVDVGTSRLVIQSRVANGKTLSISNETGQVQTFFDSNGSLNATSFNVQSFLIGYTFRGNVGSAAIPSISFNNSNATGLFGGVGTLGFSTNGVERGRFDPVGNFAIGSSSPFAKFTVVGAAGTTTNLAIFATSTAAGATTTVFAIDGNGNTTIGGNGSVLTINGATTTASNGFNISAGCFAVNGTCIPNTNDGTFSTTSASYFSSLGLAHSTTSSAYFLSQNTGNAFSSTSALFFSSVGLAHSTTSVAYQMTQTPVFTNGFTAFASSTIGNGTATGGLTINGGATTTGNAYFGSSLKIVGSANFAPISTSTLISLNGVNVFNASTSGSVGLGLSALRAETVGRNNIAFGTLSLGANLQSSGNVAVGNSALASNVGTSSASGAISTISSGSSSGYPGGYTTVSFNSNAGTKPAVGDLVTIAGTAGYDGTWTVIADVTFGYSFIIDAPYGANETFGGAATYTVAAGNVTPGNVAIGNKALFTNTSGGNNVALGNSALFSNTIGFNNIAHGFRALYANTTGTDNLAQGEKALTSNTTGTSNIAIGSEAMYNNATGSNNIAQGRRALRLNTGGSNNIAIGLSALSGNNASGNVAIGFASLPSNTTGGNNTALGFQSGYNISTGYSNVMLGDNDQFSGGITSGGGNIGIGSNTFFSSPAANRQLNIGNILFGTLPATSTAWSLPTSGTIGIGTTSPTSKFGIAANSGDTLTTLFQISSSTANSTTTLFSISNTGSTTASNGFNITAGCYAVNGTCIPNASDGTFSTTSASYFSSLGLAFSTTSSSYFLSQNTGNAFSTTSALFFSSVGLAHSTTSVAYQLTQTPVFTNGFTAFASSTIGNGTQKGGLTINGGATTTGTAYFAGNVGIGTTTPSQALEVNGKIQMTAAGGNSTGDINMGPNGFYSFANAGRYLRMNSNGSLNDITSVGAALTINFGGSQNVGIGALLNPQAQLSVANNLAVGVADGTLAPTNGALFGGNVGIGTTSPNARLSIFANVGDTNTTIFNIASSTGVATTTLFSISNTGSTTASNGFNISAGCFSINGVCQGNASGFSTTSASYFSSNGLAFSTTSSSFLLSQTPVFTNGFTAFASSTIGNSTQTGGLTINGGATTTGNAYFAAKVGIGTATPSYALQIVTNGASDGISQYNTGGFQAYSLAASASGGDNGQLNLNNANVLGVQLRGSGISYFTGGNVGIGTTSPYAKLSVVGNVVADSYFATSTTATSTFAGGLNVGNGAITYDYSSGQTSIQNLVLGNMSFDSDSGIINWTDMPVTASSSNGTVNSYTANLDGNPLLTIYGESDGAGGVQRTGVGIGTSSPWARLSVDTSNLASTTFAFVVGSSTRNFLTISNTGNGTTTLSGLAIAGSATSSSNVGFNLSAGCYAINGSCIGGSVAATASTTLLADINSWTNLQRFNGGLLAFASTTIGNGTQTGGLTIFGGATTTGNAYFGGNVGIGTSTPFAALSISGTSGATSTALAVYGGSGAVVSNAGGTGSNIFLQSGNGGSGSNSNGIGGSIELYAGTGGSNITPPNAGLGGSIYIAPGLSPLGNTAGDGNLLLGITKSGVAIGKVGVGTTSPSQSLSVNGKVYTTGGIQFGDGTLQTSAAAGAASALAGQFAYFAINGTTVSGTSTLFVSPAGNVGIGTSTPSQTLDVNGTSIFRNTMSFGSAAATGDQGLLSWTTNIGGSGQSAFLLRGQAGVGLALGSNGNSANLYMNTAGNVGIGTTTPGSRLSVFQNYGDSLSTVFDVSSSTNAANTTKTSFLSVSSTGFGTTTLSGLNVSGSATSTSNVGFNINSGCFALNGICLPTSDTSFSTTSASYFSSLGLAFSTTSDNYWSSVGLGHSTTSVAYQLAQNTTLGNSTSTTFFTTTASSTNLFSNAATIGTLSAGALTATGNTSLQQATSTTFFTTTASSTNFFTNTATIGTLTAGNGSFSGTLGVTGLSTLSGGIFSLASSTIGNGTATGGLTINGGATTTGNAYFGGNTGHGTTTPFAFLALAANSGTNYPGNNLFLISSSTSNSTVNHFAIDNTGRVTIGNISPVSTTTQLSILSGTTTLQRVGTGTLLNSAVGMAIQGHTAFVVDGSVLEVWDISNSQTPVRLINKSLITSAGRIAVQGNYAYLADNGVANIFEIWDISNPGNPIRVSFGNMNQAGRGIYVTGRYMYLAGNGTTNALEIWDVGNPAAPVRVGQGTLSNGASQIVVQGRYAVVAIPSFTQEIWDISNPTAPVRVASPSLSAQFGNTVAVQGRYIYFAATGASSNFEIWDMATSTAPVRVSISSMANAASAISVQGRYAYISQSGSTLQTWDVSNPARPVLVNQNTISAAGQAMAVQGRFAYLGNQTTASGFEVWDLGGAYIQQLETGGLETGTLSVKNNIYAMDESLWGSLNVSQSLSVNGGAVFTYSSSTAFNTNQTIFSIMHPTSTAISNATSTGSIFAVLANANAGFGTSSPLANLVVQNNYGSTNANIFQVASSTSFAGATQTNFLSVSSTGFGTTTLSGLNVSGSATSTSNVGFNITAGCYAVNGACLSTGGSSASSTLLTDTNTWTTGINQFNGGLRASSTAMLSTLFLSGGLNFAATTSTSTIATFATQSFIVASTTGFNTSLGLNALSSITNGARNTALGHQSLGNATSTTDNTAIGYQALLGSTAQFTATNNTAVGSQALKANTTGDNSVAIGYRALTAVTTGNNNVAVGAAALQSDIDGAGNTAVGASALIANTSGNNNSSIGQNSLFTNTTGSDNTALGMSALQQSRTGGSNVAIGSSASQRNASATSSTAVGYLAAFGVSGNFNAQGYTVLGYKAGQNFMTGADYNSLFGYQSGSAITTGARNILLGSSETANNLTIGYENIGIGNNIFFPATSTNQMLNIGNLIFGTLPATSTSFALPTSGTVGIGTTSPTSKFGIALNSGDTLGTAFQISSSTNNSTTTLLSVSNIGQLTVSNGINITSGCFSVGGTCIGYVKRLAGIFATSSVGTNVTVTKSVAGLAFSAGALTIPASTTEMVIETWGGGGGGGGASTATTGSGGVGGSGATTCFGTNATACTTPLLQAAGGSGGLGASDNSVYNAAGGAGGAGSVGVLNLSGQGGSIGGVGEATAGGRGGAGGSAPRGGGGGASGVGSSGGTGAAFGGGAGGGGGTAANTDGGGGGGAGGYSQQIVSSPSGTYYYTVGGGGTAGTGGGGTESTGGAGGTGGVVITVYATSSATATGNDYAEMFPVSNPGINAADIVAVDVGAPVSMKLAQNGDTLAGVIATQPGQLLGDIGATGMRPVALMGRVPTKVNMEGGEINIGDRIALSSVAGVGKKAGPFDDSVGIAIDNYPTASSTHTTHTGSVMVFLNLQDGLDINAIAFSLLRSEAIASIASTTASSTSPNQPLDFVGGMMHAFTSRIGMFTWNATATSTARSVIATSTTQDSLAFGFMQGMFTKMTEWFASAANGIGSLFAKEIHTDKLCVSDTSGETCVSKAQLDALLVGAAAAASPQNSPAVDTSTAATSSNSTTATSTASTPDPVVPAVDTATTQTPVSAAPIVPAPTSDTPPTVSTITTP